MTKKHILFCMLLCLAVYQMLAQNDKYPIGIQPFTCSVKTNNEGNIPSVGNKNELLQQLYGIVASAFQKSKLFVIVERTRNDAIKAEQNFQKNIDFTGGTTQIEETAFIGAKYVVVGNLANVAIIQGAFAGDVKISVSYDMKILDITTGEVKAAEHFESEALSKTADAAFNAAVTNTQTAIVQFLFNNFKPEILVLEVEEKTDNAAKVLVINGGISGLKKGSLLKITEEIAYQNEGKTFIRKKEIGQAKILSLESDNFATAEVSKNGIEILAKFSAGTKLKAIPMQESVIEVEESPVIAKPKKEKKKKENEDYY